MLILFLIPFFYPLSSLHSSHTYLSLLLFSSFSSPFSAWTLLLLTCPFSRGLPFAHPSSRSLLHAFSFPPSLLFAHPCPHSILLLIFLTSFFSHILLPSTFFILLSPHCSTRSPLLINTSPFILSSSTFSSLCFAPYFYSLIPFNHGSPFANAFFLLSSTRLFFSPPFTCSFLSSFPSTLFLISVYSVIRLPLFFIFFV